MTYAQIYRDLYREANLVDRVADVDNESEEIQSVLAVFDEFNRNLGTDASNICYLGDVNQFYDHLDRRAIASFNPTSDITEEYNWTREEKDNPALSPSGRTDIRHRRISGRGTSRTHVVQLGTSAKRGRVTPRVQFVLEGNDPHIHFEEHKNGPGTVTLIYGRETLADCLDDLGSRDRD